MTKIRIEDLDDKSRKIIRAYGNISYALGYMEDNHPPEDLHDAVKAVEVAGQALNIAWTVLRTHARDIAIKYVSDESYDVVRFVDEDGESIASLVIVNERSSND